MSACVCVLAVCYIQKNDHILTAFFFSALIHISVRVLNESSVVETVPEDLRGLEKVEELEESDDDMGFGLFDGPGGGSYSMVSQSFSAPSPAPVVANMAPMMMMKRSAPVAVSALRLEAERAVKRQFKPLDLTKEMGETYYYNRRDIAPSDKEANLFWLDFIQWVQSQSGSFLSQVST